MRVKKGFVLREIADTIVVVPTGDLLEEFKGLINLNSTGKFIWELLQKDITLEEIADKFAEEYKVDKDRAMKNTEKFVQSLKDANIIEE